MKVILNAVDYKDRNLDLDFTPDPRIVLSGADEIALMDDDRRRRGKFTS
jgi:polyphosphate kinase